MPPAEMPPLALPKAVEPSAVPNGEPVSKPLQSAEEKPPVPDNAFEIAPKVVAAPPARSLGRAWDRTEILYWWPKAAPMPPLITTSRNGSSPVLGGPHTQTLVGGQALDALDAGGLRLIVGGAINEAQTAGTEVSYFFLGSRSSTARFFSDGLPGSRVLGRPFLNASTGLEDVQPIAVPGVGGGLAVVSVTSRMTGWEVNGVGNLMATPNARLDVNAGYRYFMFNEGLRVEQTSMRFPLPDGSPQILSAGADQIDAHNRFHGGQIGLQGTLSQGVVFLEVSGKMAFGRTTEVYKTSGQTTIYTAGSILPLIQPVNAGVLIGPGNSGRVAKTSIAYLPEGQMKLGCTVGENSIFYVGYNFLYLSQAIRAGDQIDRTINPENIAIQPRTGNILPPADRTFLPLRQTDFWVQGLVFGFEARY